MRLRRIPVLLALVFLATTIPAFAEFYTDWLWFNEVGYQQVYVRSLTAHGTVTAVVAAIVFALLALNLSLAMRALRARPFLIATPQGPQTIMMDPARIRPLALGAAAIIAVLVGLFAGGQWETWLYFLNGTSFGTADPILGRDVSFYVFTLPLLELVQGLLYFTCLLMIGVALAAYLFGGEIGLEPAGRVYVSRRATQHVGLLAAAMLLILAFSAWL